MQGETANPIMTFAPILLMFGIIYFLMIRPQQKKQKDHQEMVKGLKKGDKVVTSGGILGIVHTLQDDYVVIKTGDSDTKMEVLRSHISEVRK
jgi:preprotein translocase subunit YajC